MGYEEEGLDLPQEKFFQPDDGINVQVIGGLIQEEDVRYRHQRPGQEHPPFRAAGEVGKFGIRIERKTTEDPFHFLVHVPAARFLQGLVDLLQPLQQVVVSCR